MSNPVTNAVTVDSEAEAKALADRAGFLWYDTESAARQMARHAAEEILALRSALTACEKQRTWQPIETAPKDGTSILIYGGTYNDNEGYYHDMECRFPTLAFWSGNYMPHWHGDNLDGHDRWNVHQPTHWMPLPEAPK